MSYRIPKTRVNDTQSGFTLFELLLAMILVLAVVIGVQQFMAGVVSDQNMIGDRQADASETQIVLSNLSRDVARANFYPYATFGGGLANSGQLAACAGAGCQNLFGVRYAAPAGAADCNGNRVQGNVINNTSVGWTLIQNRYVLTTVNGVQRLSCDGSGGNVGQRRQINQVVQVTANAILNDGTNVNLTNAPQFIPANTQLVRICIVTRVPQRQIVGDVAAATTNCTNQALANNAGWVNYKIMLDVVVGSHSFLSGASP
jgi:Tfp pilus assembly protein PilV